MNYRIGDRVKRGFGMKFKPGDRVICVETSGSIIKGTRGTIIDATKTRHGEEHGKLGVIFDGYDYGPVKEENFHIIKYFSLKKASKLEQVLV